MRSQNATRPAPDHRPVSFVALAGLPAWWISSCTALAVILPSQPVRQWRLDDLSGHGRVGGLQFGAGRGTNSCIPSPVDTGTSCADMVSPRQA